MTLTSLASPLAAALTVGLTVFNSDFLVVTEAFDCTEADMTSTPDKFFFVGVTVAEVTDLVTELVTELVTTGTAARTALRAVLALDCFAEAAVAAITGDLTAFTALAVTLPEGLATGVFFDADRAATGSD